MFKTIKVSVCENKLMQVGVKKILLHVRSVLASCGGKMTGAEMMVILVLLCTILFFSGRITYVHLLLFLLFASLGSFELVFNHHNVASFSLVEKIQILLHILG